MLGESIQFSVISCQFVRRRRPGAGLYSMATWRPKGPIALHPSGRPHTARLRMADLFPFDELDRDAVRVFVVDAREAGGRPDAVLGVGDLDIVASEKGNGLVEIFDLDANREQAFAALLELLVEAPLFLDGLHQLEEGVADREAGDLEAGAERVVER